MRADGIQEVAIVRDDDQGALVATQEFVEPVNGVEVQVVRRFVQQKGLRMSEQGLRQENADLLSALQLGHLAIVQRLRDVEALEQDGGVAFGAVAVLFADDAFELAEAHAVLVGHVRLLVEDVAFLQSAPQAFVPHDDRVDDLELVELVLVLAEDADLLRADDRPLLGRELTRKELHEGRLAGPVRARSGRICGPGKTSR